MNNKKNNDIETVDDICVKQLNPKKELSDLEKTAILQFEIDKEEELSKTMEFKLLNSAKHKPSKMGVFDLPSLKKDDEFELPRLKPTLGESIKAKIADLRDNIPDEKPNKSLYDTIILKLDDIINNNKALKQTDSKKVMAIEKPKRHKKHFHLFKVRDITKAKKFHLNVDSEEYGRQLYNLNKIALTNLSNKPHEKVKARKYSSLNKLQKIDKVHVSKRNYQKYQQQLNKFAIDKLYYKLAPKESNKYKLYRACVFLSLFIFLMTSIVILNWAIQGISINKLSNAMNESTPIKKVSDGEVINVDEPEDNTDVSVTESLYWKYLKTPLSSVDLSELYKENNDTVGWLIVKNTNINYPVVQTTNNEYYLSHAFDKTSNGAGWVYADFRDNFADFNSNMVIYGHGRKDKVMFGSLTNTLNSEWYKNTDNQIIQLSTIKYNTMWQIFAIYKVEAESYYITTDFADDEAFTKFLKEMKSRSIYDFGINLNKDDKILTLSTCYNDNGIRLVVQAKLVKIQAR